jgi:cytochrome c peroxidase
VIGKKWLAAFALSALAACDGGSAPSAQAPASPASAAPSGVASAAVRKPEGLRIPVEAAAAARAALARAIPGKDANNPDYLAFRREVARGEPFFRGLGFQAEALFGGGPADEIGGALGRLDVAMEAGEKKAIEESAAEVSRALRLLEDSLSRSPVQPAQLPDILPRAVYWLGAALAGSKPGLSRIPAAAVADALGLLDAIQQASALALALVSPAQDTGEALARLEPRFLAVRKALEPARATGELSDRARLCLLTGRIGADLRALLSPFGKPWNPYAPRVPGQGSALEEPTTVLTVPVLGRGARRDPAEEERLADVGEKLFSDRTLSKGGKRSCATCHVPSKGYSDGKARPESLLPEAPILRNAPTLLYAPLHAAQFWDGRALTSERQALLVMHSKAEMGGVDSAFPREGAESVEVAAAALAAFQARRLVPASSPLDRFARGDEAALSDEDRAGFDVFAGKGRCARCHVPPLFGGSHPPDFSTAVYSVLGVPETAAGKSLDPDRGRAAVTRQEIHAGAFKTPTVRNAVKTAPYFHNGAFSTLEAVIDFYDKGGGKGLGLSLPNQDPDVVPLRLTKGDRSALLRFLRVALTDASATR